ncbi:MAG: hypothetical protein O7J95_16850 [Planctomycetota bacterium]|nr:hypothetical protein [Planctomycetota bacterium]
MASRCPLSFRPFLPGLLAALAGCAVVESRPVRNPTSRGIHYFLPRVRLRLAVTARAGEDGGLEDLQLALEETVFEPDPRAFYRLDYRASAFSADEVEISLTPNGLLERISAVTDESSDDLAVRIVESAAEISRAIAAIPGARVAGRRTTVYEATVDPTDRAEVAALNEDLRRYGRAHGAFPPAVSALAAPRASLE